MSDVLREIKDYPDLDFIDGYTIDQLESELIAKFKEKKEELTEETVTLGAGDERRLILSACAYYLFLGYKFVDTAAKMGTLKYSVGDFLENLGARVKVSRLAARAATSTIRYSMEEPRTSATSIPAGSRVTAGDGVFFATDEYAEIPIGSRYVDVKATCTITGTEGNAYAVGDLKTMVDIVPYIDSVSNITAAENGRDVESDDDLRERIYLAPNGYTTAGSKGAYEYMVREYDSSIEDVYITSPSEREVHIAVLLEDGQLPGTEFLSGLRDFISEDDRKMLTDEITVSAPTAVNYNLTMTYYINESDKAQAVQIQNAVSQAVTDYIEWQQSKIGRDINPNELSKRVMNAGAKRLVITAPSYAVVAAGSVAVAQNVSVTYGGLEDD